MICAYIIIFSSSLKEDESNNKLYSDCKIGISDSDNTELTQKMIASFEEKYTIIHLNKEDVNQNLIKNKINYAVIIYEGFTNDVIEGKKIELNTISMTGSPLFTFFEEELNTMLSVYIVTGHITKGEDEFYSYLKGITEDSVGLNIVLNETSTDVNKMGTTTYVFWGFIIFFLIYYNCYFGSKFLEDKLAGIITRVTNTKFTYGKYVLYQMLSELLIGIIQIAIMSVLLLSLANPETKRVITMILPVLFFTNFTGLLLGIFIATLSKSKSMFLALLLIIVNYLAMIGGLYWSVNLMPSFMIKMAKLTPTYWLKTMMDNALDGTSIHQGKILIINLGFLLIIFIMTIMINALRKER